MSSTHLPLPAETTSEPGPSGTSSTGVFGLEVWQTIYDNLSKQDLTLMMRTSKGLYELAAPEVYRVFEVNDRSDAVFDDIYALDGEPKQKAVKKAFRALRSEREQFEKRHSESIDKDRGPIHPPFFDYTPSTIMSRSPHQLLFSLRRRVALLSRVKHITISTLPRKNKKQEDKNYRLIAEWEAEKGIKDLLPLCPLRPTVTLSRDVIDEPKGRAAITRTWAKLRHLANPSQICVEVEGRYWYIGYKPRVESILSERLQYLFYDRPKLETLCMHGWSPVVKTPEIPVTTLRLCPGPSMLSMIQPTSATMCKGIVHKTREAVGRGVKRVEIVFDRTWVEHKLDEGETVAEYLVTMARTLWAAYIDRYPEDEETAQVLQICRIGISDEVEHGQALSTPGTRPDKVCVHSSTNESRVGWISFPGVQEAE